METGWGCWALGEEEDIRTWEGWSNRILGETADCETARFVLLCKYY